MMMDLNFHVSISGLPEDPERGYSVSKGSFVFVLLQDGSVAYGYVTGFIEYGENDSFLCLRNGHLVNYFILSTIEQIYYKCDLCQYNKSGLGDEDSCCLLCDMEYSNFAADTSNEVVKKISASFG